MTELPTDGPREPLPTCTIHCDVLADKHTEECNLLTRQTVKIQKDLLKRMHEAFASRQAELEQLRESFERSQTAYARALEHSRSSMHHDIIRDVLREQMRNDGTGFIHSGLLDQMIESAVYAADKLYPRERS